MTKLEHIQAEERIPPHDELKETAYKVGGRFFFVPTEYARSARDHSFDFYWINSKPMTRMSAGKHGNLPEVSYREKAIKVHIQSIGTADSEIPHSPFSSREQMELFDAKGHLEAPVIISPGVVRRDIQQSDPHSGARAFCIATESMSLDGKPAVMVCPGARSTALPGLWGTAFVLKPGIRLAAHIHSRNLSDWPKINEELVRVAGLIGEE